MDSEASHGTHEGLTSCQSPLCSVEFKQTGMAMQPRRYCCDQCKMDVHALRRAKALLVKVGIVRFHELLDQL